MFDSNEPHAAPFPAPAHELPKKAGSAIFGVGSYPDKDVEGWLRRMCILRCEATTSGGPLKRRAIVFPEREATAVYRNLDMFWARSFGCRWRRRRGVRARPASSSASSIVLMLSSSRAERAGVSEGIR